ncbi:MAG TPA: DUF1552 domain-containing protein, partial [Polyangiaceae bacterium]|nr:DUF1552 domain-containing protein [Polyangiaceae bacterium]
MRISRRAALRGLGGTLLALPALEVMGGGDAVAQTVPRRYFVSFCGASIGRHTSSTAHGDLFVPSSYGPGYELTRGLAPLGNIEGYGSVQDEISVVSNLKIPWAVNGVVPAGGRPVSFHEYFMSPLLSGMRSSGNDLSSATMHGPTSDWIMSEALGGADTLFENLVYKVQAHSYLGGNGQNGDRSRMSYRTSGDSLEPVDGTINPKQAYDTLFTGFEPADPVEKEKRAFELSRRKSVIDLVRTQSERLMQKLGAADKQRMQKHYDEIRALEERLHALGPDVGGACQLLDDPGDDWPIGNGIAGDAAYNVNEGYSNEDQRALVMSDLICMAFACDLTRTAALMFTHPHCWMNMYQLTGAPSDFHELSHGPNSAPGATPLESLTDGLAWHVQHFGRIVGKLRDMQEPDGSSLLDHTALLLLFEGGHGYDPSDGAPNRAHSTENMAA